MNKNVNIKTILCSCLDTTHFRTHLFWHTIYLFPDIKHKIQCSHLIFNSFMCYSVWQGWDANNIQQLIFIHLYFEGPLSFHLTVWYQWLEPSKQMVRINSTISARWGHFKSIIKHQQNDVIITFWIRLNWKRKFCPYLCAFDNTKLR